MKVRYNFQNSAPMAGCLKQERNQQQPVIYTQHWFASNFFTSALTSITTIKKKCFLMFILWEREREEEQGEGQREREGERIPSRLHTVTAEPDVGLETTNCEIITWAKASRVRCLTNWATQAPKFCYHLYFPSEMKPGHSGGLKPTGQDWTQAGASLLLSTIRPCYQGVSAAHLQPLGGN